MSKGDATCKYVTDRDYDNGGGHRTTTDLIATKSVHRGGRPLLAAAGREAEKLGDPSNVNEWIFRLTQLKLLDKRHHKNDSANNMYTILEDANSKVDENYYNLMRKCRALSGEKLYEVYVMRLINIGCRPLGDKEWRKELDDTEKTNNVAKLQMDLHNVNKLNT
ncbi:uncharacterized protein LOC132945726 [Metopolophium dirhodum]|uniref:uncharacterized protein LOC132945726 n=1 Tax=Metopolophium dirhodum TaxID=44670 RepID=UPI0029906A3D|nr:uncharacterized protein LOC132945726 [Metopolophium dirhodum]